METLDNQLGYDEDIFIAKVPEYLHCMLCSLVLRNPVQILCCGHKMCDYCFQSMKTCAKTTNSKVRCPIDRGLVDVNDVREDKHLKRVIGDMAVVCHEISRGCHWTGYLRELDTHYDQCSFKALQQRDEGAQLITLDTVESLSSRLEQCKNSLLQKDQEIELLQQQAQKQQQLKKEVQSLKQQHEEDVTKLQQNYEVFEQKIIGTLLQHQQKCEKLEQTYEKSEQEHQVINNLTSSEEVERFKNPSGKEGEHTSSSSHVRSYGDTTTTVCVVNEQRFVIPKKKIFLKHHCGDIRAAAINNDNHSVVFCQSLVTVSAPSVVIPPRTKVWYEVECTHWGVGWGILGWATADMPTSSEWIGSGNHSYGFRPFDAYKYHKGGKRWGKKFIGGKGVVGVALDLVNRNILFSVDGQWTKPMGTAFTGIPKKSKYFPAITGGYATIIYNFGDREFKYGPPNPTFKALVDVI